MRKVTGIVVMLAAIAALYPLVVRRYIANNALLGVQRSTDVIFSPEADEVVRANGGRANLVTLDRIRTGSPQDQATAMLHGSNLQILGRHAEAELFFTEALSWGKRPEILVALASSQAANDKREEATNSLYEVARFDPYMLTRSDRADIRDLALARLEQSSTREMIGEAYLNMAIGYFNAGFLEDGAGTMARGAMHDPSILTRREFVWWGGIPGWMALERYNALRQNAAARRTP